MMPPDLPRAVAVCILLACAAVGPTAKRVQAGPQALTSWDGVYTSEQATRGKGSYDAACSRCHGEALEGRNGRALSGARFWQDWGEDRLDSLFNVTRATMPRDNPGTISDETYLDIIAYVLQKNGYPAGRDALTADSVERIQVVRQEGPGPVPNFALVTVVGCLAQQDRGVWTLSKASEPIRTRDPGPSTGAERERSESTNRGAHTYELMDVYSQGAGHIGHRLEVKGLLIRGAPDRVNVTSMQMLSAVCAP